MEEFHSRIESVKTGGAGVPEGRDTVVTFKSHSNDDKLRIGNPTNPNPCNIRSREVRILHPKARLW